MKQIGFKNFRKFANFPAIELAPITILVGENNAGKSTVVKGLLALSDFLNGKGETGDYLFVRTGEKKSKKKDIIEKLKNQKFNFNTSYLAHIGTFKRALYNNADEDNSVISFFTSVGHQDITIDISGDRNDEECVSGTISKVCLDYKAIGVHIEFDLQMDIAKVLFNPVDVSETQLDYLPPRRRNEAKQFLESIPRSYEFRYHISDYYRNYLSDFIYLLIASVEIAISASMEFDKTKEHIGAEMASELKPNTSVDSETLDFLKEFTQKVCETYFKGEEWIFMLPESDRIGKLFRIEYIYAHSVSQNVIYSTKDSNDYLSNTIHEFASIPKTNQDYRREFISHWMKEFNIGVDYEITSVGGEAHLVKIIDADGTTVNLADKGMGSIQLMVLLFRLAITLPKKPVSVKESKNRIVFSRISRVIIVEEPEQNLHPMLQSKLAELFFELNKLYNYRFIIETHSEYIIRRSQVIVGDNFNTQDKLDKENPFKVYYFPAKGIPYDMIYTPSGLFEKKFGDGFINEAGKLHMAVLRNAKRQD